MKTTLKFFKILFIWAIVLGLQNAFSQSQKSFQEGEWIKLKMSYSGWLKAGEATLEVKNAKYKDKPVYHVLGHGKTTGPINWLFFKVRDRYESYLDKETGLPYKFIRQIDEGGHTKDIEIEFDHANKKAHVNNKKHNVRETYSIEKDVQDMLSAFYYLRNNYDTDTIKEGDMVALNMFFDEENFKFQLKFLGRETIKTKFGKIKSLKFRPYVSAGRVFKEQESLTLWVSADKNKIPLKIKADLAVGSLRAEIVERKGLKHPFPIIFEK